MTNKKQIIIDTNEYFLEVVDESKSTIGYTVVFPQKLLTKIIKQNKQLARKTQECEEKDERIIELTKAGRELKQECEELKIKIEEWNAANVELAVELDRYRKALEEIEKIVQTITETNKVYPLQNNLFKILDIIKTAKGEE